jgi:putative restriction endonuclease
MPAIFDTKTNSGYDDEVAHRYHFPNRYLPEAQRALGDWIIYREPRRGGGREGYVAVARLDRIDPDPADPRLSYAIVSSYLPFDRVVPLRREQGFYEERLDLIEAPSRLGAALQGKSIRTISEPEFAAIVRAGLSETLLPANAVRLGIDPQTAATEIAALTFSDPSEQQRRLATILLNRKIRDAAFRRAVLDAYDNTCAVTGFRLINGGGAAEAQAAHIWPVAEDGPDVVQNGLALSGTIHWLFDRHLISLTDDYALLVAHNRVPAELRSLFTRQLDRIHLPKDPVLWPHPAYIQRHRNIFVG